MALIDQDDASHLRCRAVLHLLPATPLLTTWPCLVEAMYLLWCSGAFPAQEELLSVEYEENHQGKEVKRKRK